MKINALETPTVSLIFSDLELRCIPPIDHVQDFGLPGLHIDHATCPTCGLEFEGELHKTYSCEQCGTHNKQFKRIRTAG